MICNRKHKHTHWAASIYLTSLIRHFCMWSLLKLTMTAPALKGSMNVLRACTKSPSVKRVVMTSSCSAIRYDYNRSEKDPPLDETVWSNIEYCREYKVWAQISHSTKARSMLWTHLSSDRTSLYEHKRIELHIEIHSCPQNMINRYLLCWWIFQLEALNSFSWCESVVCNFHCNFPWHPAIIFSGKVSSWEWGNEVCKTLGFFIIIWSNIILMSMNLNST